MQLRLLLCLIEDHCTNVNFPNVFFRKIDQNFTTAISKIIIDRELKFQELKFKFLLKIFIENFYFTAVKFQILSEVTHYL